MNAVQPFEEFGIVAMGVQDVQFSNVFSPGTKRIEFVSSYCGRATTESWMRRKMILPVAFWTGWKDGSRRIWKHSTIPSTN